MRLLILGCGNVGRRLALALATGVPGLGGTDVVGVCTRRHGALINPGGIDLASIAAPGAVPPWSPGHPDSTELDSATAVSTLDFDVLVELSILSISARGEPAASYVRRALERGRHVVTANKGPLAFHGRRLLELAHANGVRLLFESTVMDGTPVFSLVREGLRGCRVTSVEGILNSTSGLVLDALERGAAMEAAIRAAQQAGFAEADPTHDLEGWDSAAKLAVMANAWMGADLSPLDVSRRGILEISVQEAQGARDRNRTWKLVCRAGIESGVVRASVKPTLLPREDPLAACGPTDCILTIGTDCLSPFAIRQFEPGLADTAYGVLNDLLTIADARE